MLVEDREDHIHPTRRNSVYIDQTAIMCALKGGLIIAARVTLSAHVGEKEVLS